MFSATRKQMAVITGMGIRVPSAREKDKKQTLEFKFSVPMDQALADEILPLLAAKLYDDDGEPVAEILDLGFMVPDLAMQRLVVYAHPDMPAIAEYRHASIRDISVVKADEGQSFTLKFTAGWVFEAVAGDLEMMKLIKRGSAFIQMEPEQAKMDLQPEAPAAEAAAAGEEEAAGPKSRGARNGARKGTRGQRGRRKTPEQEDAEQIAAGNQVLDRERGTVEEFTDDPQTRPAEGGDEESDQGIETQGTGGTGGQVVNWPH